MYEATSELVGSFFFRVKIKEEADSGTFQVNEDGGKATLGRISVEIAKYREEHVQEKSLRDFLYETFEERGIARNNIVFYLAKCSNDIAARCRRGSADAIYGSPKTIGDIREEVLNAWGFGKLNFIESDLFADDELFIVYEGVKSKRSDNRPHSEWPFLCRDGQIASHDQTTNAGYLLRIKESQ